VALAILAVQGTVGSGLLAAAIFGLAFLLVAIVLFGLFNLSTGNWLLAILSVLVVAVTQGSVALFLYSMLWEE